MIPLPAATVEQIRREKAEGISLKALAEKYNCAKSTASLYCRDFFHHPQRIYVTEAQARSAVTKRNKGKSHHTRPEKRTYYKCTGGCGQDIRRKDGLCLRCYTIRIHEETLQRQRAAETQEIRRQKMAPKQPLLRWRAPETDPCKASPTRAHYWVLDASNNGVCKYCNRTKTFPSPDISWWPPKPATIAQI